MARIVLCCWGSYGDLFPYLAIAAGLRGGGHDVVLAAPAFYKDKIEEHGLQFAPLSPNVDPSDAETIRRVMDPVRGTEVVVGELIAPVVRQAFAELVPVVRGADLVVTHPVTFAARIAAEHVQVPWISSVLAPASMFSRHDFPIFPPYPAVLRAVRQHPLLGAAFMKIAKRVTARWTAPVRELRAELRLPPAGEPLYEGQFSTTGTLALFSPVFGPPQRDWPPNTTATGFAFYDEPAGEMPTEVVAFLDDGPPPVVFTLGSSAVGAAGGFYDESVAAAELLGVRALLLVGRDPRNRSRRPLGASIQAVEYVPHGLLLPRAAAVVHHGGIGTTARALASGRPMLVVPHAHDQFDNADRARRIGVGETLPAAQYNQRRAARLLDKLLRQPSYSARAHAVASQLATENGVDAACRVIAELASRSSNNVRS